MHQDENYSTYELIHGERVKVVPHHYLTPHEKESRLIVVVPGPPTKLDLKETSNHASEVFINKSEGSSKIEEATSTNFSDFNFSNQSKSAFKDEKATSTRSLDSNRSRQLQPELETKEIQTQPPYKNCNRSATQNQYNPPVSNSKNLRACGRSKNVSYPSGMSNFYVLSKKIERILSTRKPSEDLIVIDTRHQSKILKNNGSTTNNNKTIATSSKTQNLPQKISSHNSQWISNPSNENSTSSTMASSRTESVDVFSPHQNISNPIVESSHRLDNDLPLFLLETFEALFLLMMAIVLLSIGLQIFKIV